LKKRQWLDERRQGITATDIAAICGASKYKSAIDVYLDKRGLAEQLPENDAMLWGKLMEPVIAGHYARRNRVRLERPGLMTHKDIGWIRGTPDRLIAGQSKGLEIKTASSRMSGHWGNSGTDDVPTEYLLQCAWYMLLTGFPEWDIALKIDSADYREYTILRNECLESRLLEMADRFWHENVLAKEPPPPDGSASYARYIAEIYQSDSGSMIQETPESRECAVKLAYAETAIAASEKTAEEMRNRLKTVIGESSGIIGACWKCTWKKSRDVFKTDYEKAFHGLEAAGVIPEDILREALRSAGCAKPGSRRFIFKPEDGLLRGNDLMEAV
jgi:putative phage-type endonuclease